MDARKAAFKIEVLPASGKNFSLTGTREDKHRDDVSEHHLGNRLEPVDFQGGVAKYVNLAQTHQLDWPSISELTQTELEHRLLGD